MSRTPCQHIYLWVASSQAFYYANAMNIRELIESVGGIRAAARLLGVAPSTAHYYCKTNRVPLKRLLMLASVSEMLSKGRFKYDQIIKEHGL